VNWSHYWRQKVLITWPWNPEKGEELDLNARQTYVLIVLLFNLLVLTLWSEVVVRTNSTMASIIPSASSYFSRYLGSTFITWLFFVVFKPLLTFVFVTAPVWQRNPDSCTKRVFGFILGYILQIAFVLLLVAVAYSTLLLMTQYRCSVLIRSLIIPFFAYELLKMVFVLGFIPLPIWYYFVNGYGPELYAEDYRALPAHDREPAHRARTRRSCGGDARHDYDEVGEDAPLQGEEPPPL